MTDILLRKTLQPYVSILASHWILWSIETEKLEIKIIKKNVIKILIYYLFNTTSIKHVFY